MNWLFFLGFILYLFSFVFFELFGPSYFINSLSIIFLFYYCFRIIKERNDFSSVSIFFIFSYAITGAICFISEFGGYFTEIRQFSYITGATARNAYLSVFTIHFASMAFYFVDRFNFRILSVGGGFKLIENIIIIPIYSSIIAVLFFIGIRYGHPNDYGVDRFYYWNNIAPSWGQSLGYFAEIFMIFLGRMYVARNSKIYIIMLFAGLVSFYMTGDKFTGMFNSIVLFLIPVFLLSGKSLSGILFNKKFILTSIIALISLLVATYVSYLFIYSGDGSKAIEMVMVRLFLQAQMWWAVDGVSDLYPKSISVIWDSFFGFFSSPDKNGVFYLMKLVAPSSVFYSMFEDGVTFTMSYPANLSYFFGFALSPLASAACGVVIGIIMNLFKRVVVGGPSVLLPLATAIYYATVQAFLMGRTYHLLSIRFLLSLFIIIVFILISNSNSFTKRVG